MIIHLNTIIFADYFADLWNSFGRRAGRVLAPSPDLKSSRGDINKNLLDKILFQG
jgi:hypothetical protein